LADGFSIDVDTSALVAALTSLGDFAQPFVNEASAESAHSIVREAQSRLTSKLSGTSTGQTLQGIQDRPAFDGNGWVVISDNDRMPNLPLWLEKGTKRHKARGHSQPALGYFYSAVQLEEGPHLRRIENALGHAIDAKGLGG
jgi:hypothetical protein